MVQNAVREIKRSFPEILVVTDVCMCQYTDHGHCGIIDEKGVNREQGKEKQVTLIPLMVAAGSHTKNDMAGEKQDSWKNILLNEGFKVNIHLHGLGEIHKFKDIYLNHIEDLIENNNRA